MEITIERLYELMWQSAGAGAGAVMRFAAPTVEMPSEEIHASLNAILRDFGYPERKMALRKRESQILPPAFPF